MATRHRSVVTAALLGLALATAACAADTNNSQVVAAKQKLNDDMNACNQLQTAQEKSSCMDTARAKYTQTVGAISACPKSTC